MNSFTFIGIGSLARKGDVAYVRFCFVGADHAQPDEEVGRASALDGVRSDGSGGRRRVPDTEMVPEVGVEPTRF